MLYEDILNTLKIKESNNAKERIKNRDFKKITTLIEQLLKTIYAEEKILIIANNTKSLEKIRITKNVLIKKIKEEIENINNIHHLHIDNIIKNEKINKEELQFALNIIYQEPKTKQEIEKTKEYSKLQTELSYINRYLETVKDNNRENMRKLKNIKEIDNEKDKPKKIKVISFIKWKKENKKANDQIEQIKQKIIKNLEDIIKHTHDDIKDKCVKEIYEIKAIIEELESKTLDNETRHNIKFKLKKTNDELETKIKKIISKKQETQEILRTNIKLSQEQLNEIIYVGNKSYAFNIALPTFQKEKNKKDELVVRVILTIKLISMIENNEINIQNMIEEEQEKRK